MSSSFGGWHSRLTSAAEDYFDRFCSVELQVVSLSPLRDMFKFSLSMLDIAGRYNDVRVICILVYAVDPSAAEFRRRSLPAPCRAAAAGKNSARRHAS